MSIAVPAPVTEVFPVGNDDRCLICRGCFDNDDIAVVLNGCGHVVCQRCHRDWQQYDVTVQQDTRPQTLLEAVRRGEGADLCPYCRTMVHTATQAVCRKFYSGRSTDEAIPIDDDEDMTETPTVTEIYSGRSTDEAIPIDDDEDMTETPTVAEAAVIEAPVAVTTTIWIPRTRHSWPTEMQVWVGDDDCTVPSQEHLELAGSFWAEFPEYAYKNVTIEVGPDGSKTVKHVTEAFSGGCDNSDDSDWEPDSDDDPATVDDVIMNDVDSDSVDDKPTPVDMEKILLRLAVIGLLLAIVTRRN